MNKELNNKIWFRFLKVVFVVCFLIAQVIGVSITYFLVSENAEKVYIEREESGFIPACKDGSKPHLSIGGESGICYEYKFSNLQAVFFCIIAFVIVSCIFKLILKTFYYIVLDKF